jgi:hypothetical protein
MNHLKIMQLLAAGEDNEKDKHNLEPVTSMPKTVLLMNLLHHCYEHSTGGSEEQNILNLELPLF